MCPNKGKAKWEADRHLHFPNPAVSHALVALIANQAVDWSIGEICMYLRMYICPVYTYMGWAWT
jgi:hypothetical protein